MQSESGCLACNWLFSRFVHWTSSFSSYVSGSRSPGHHYNHTETLSRYSRSAPRESGMALAHRYIGIYTCVHLYSYTYIYETGRSMKNADSPHTYTTRNENIPSSSGLLSAIKRIPPRVYRRLHRLLNPPPFPPSFWPSQSTMAWNQQSFFVSGVLWPTRILSFSHSQFFFSLFVFCFL